MTPAEKCHSLTLGLVICYFEFWSGAPKILASDWSAEASRFPCDFLNFYSSFEPEQKLRREGQISNCRDDPATSLPCFYACWLTLPARKTVVCSKLSLSEAASIIEQWRHKNVLHLSLSDCV